MLFGVVVLGPLKKQSLDQAAAESLRAAIISGDIPQGSRLTETSLAEQFALSRGPIRAALQRLASEGLVVLRPYSGWGVVSLSLVDARELAELRLGLEVLATRLTAERLDKEGRKALEGAFARLEQAAASGHVGDLVTADMALHSTIITHSGNRRLCEHYSLIANQLCLFISSSTLIVETMPTIVSRHREVIEPILRGAAEEAEKAARAHIIRSVEEIVERMHRESGSPMAQNGPRTAAAENRNKYKV